MNDEDPLIADPEKKKLIQHHLVLLLHADRCVKIRMDISNYSCKIQQCFATIDLLKHMKSCYLLESCPRTDCFLSRKTIMHWRDCKRADCEVCAPLQLVEDNSRFKQDEQCPFLLNPLQLLTCVVDQSINQEKKTEKVSETFTIKPTPSAPHKCIEGLQFKIPDSRSFSKRKNENVEEPKTKKNEYILRKHIEKVVYKIEPISNTDKTCIFESEDLCDLLLPTFLSFTSLDLELMPLLIESDVAERPMKFEKIEKKLKYCEYSDPWDYIDDVWWMFENAFRKHINTQNYHHCKKVIKVSKCKI